jgi:flagellin
MVSVNNNASAIMALQTLRETQNDLSGTQKRVNSGLKVADAKDGGAIYNMANDLRNRLATQENIREGVARANSIGEVALNAAQSLQKILIDMRDKATSAAQGALTSSQIAAFGVEFTALRDQIAPLLNAASFNGVNTVNNTTTVFTARLNDQDMTTGVNNATFTGADLTSAGLGLTALNLDTVMNALNSATTLSGALSTVAATVATLGAKLNALSKQSEFNAKLSDTLNKGIADLVDADLPAKSAKLQALQTKQQLGVQVLSIANQAPQMLLSLFR